MNDRISIPDALLYSLIGISIVFAVLLVLIMTILIMTACASKKKTEPEEAAQPPAEAKGSAGEVSTFDVPDRTAAMIMAITAEKTGLPLNRLRFVSIKEIKDGDEK